MDHQTLFALAQITTRANAVADLIVRVNWDIGDILQAFSDFCIRVFHCQDPCNLFFNNHAIAAALPNLESTLDQGPDAPEAAALAVNLAALYALEEFIIASS
ncbi:MAG: hypothetical protein ACREBU_09935 [Nitrososphaera sp.]